MILFDLRCSRGHDFEAWFRDGDSFERLAEAGEIQCAICGETDVRKALMAPNVQSSKTAVRRDAMAAAEEASAKPKTDRSETPAAAGAPSVPAKTAPKDNMAVLGDGTPPSMPEKLAQAMTMLREVQNHIEKTFDHVGQQFAEEARKMHYGEAEKRNIYGEATKDEAEQLAEEGIEINRMPWLPNRNS